MSLGRAGPSCRSNGSTLAGAGGGRTHAALGRMFASGVGMESLGPGVSRERTCSMSTVIGITTIVVMVLIPLYLVTMLVKTIRDERRSARVKIWPSFALGIVVCSLFFVVWVAHALVEWQKYADDQQEHGASPTAGGFVVQFGEATLQNWQSEFLEEFGLIVLTAAYLHRGSAESRDSEDRIEQKLDEVLERLNA